MLISGNCWCRAVLLSVVACLCGCIEVDQRIGVHDDGSVTLKGTLKIDPQYEALVLAERISLPGSIESVTGGKKTASDTVEFDQTHAKRGDVFVATSTAFAFSMGGGGTPATDVSKLGSAAWLIPVSIGSIGAGVALLLTGWFRSRQAARARGSTPIFAAPTVKAHEPAPVEEVASLFCSQCGAANAVGHKFCGKCGHAMG